MFYQFIKYRGRGKKKKRKREKMKGVSGYEGGSVYVRKRGKEGG